MIFPRKRKTRAGGLCVKDILKVTSSLRGDETHNPPAGRKDRGRAKMIIEIQGDILVIHGIHSFSKDSLTTFYGCATISWNGD